MRTPTDGIDYTNKDYEAFRTMMIEALQSKIPEYTDTSQSDFGIVLIELNSMACDILSYMQDSNANECFIPTCQQRKSINNWIMPMSYVPTSSSPSKVKQVFVLNSAQSSSVIIPAGTVVKTAPSTSETSIYFETEEALTIPANNLGNEQEAGEYIYTVTAVQGKTISSDPIGYSSGLSNQRFTLSNADVISSSITLSIYNGSSYEIWTLVDSFIDSTATDKVFRIEQDEDGTTEVIFGDNITGAIPTASTNNIYANYRVGGGKIGNVASNTVTLLDSTSAYIKSTFNPEKYFEKGIDREDLESIRKNIPIASRTKWGLIHEDDFSSYILLHYSSDVSLAYSAKNDIDSLQIDITLLVSDSSDFETVQATLLDELDDHLLPGGSITFSEPTYYSLDLVLTLVVKDYYTQSLIKASVISYLADYFSVGNVDFNTEIILSDLCSTIKKKIEGIKVLTFMSPADDILMTDTPDQLIQLSSITVNATGGI